MERVVARCFAVERVIEADGFQPAELAAQGERHCGKPIFGKAAEIHQASREAGVAAIGNVQAIGVVEVDIRANAPRLIQRIGDAVSYTHLHRNE